MAPSRMAGGLSQSSASSGIFFQGDPQSHLSPSFGNSANSISVTGRSNLGSGFGDVVLNSVANSGPSVGASSLVTDANSCFSGGPQLQRSASINLPASPMSFTSNNISVSGSSPLDVATAAQHDPNSQQTGQQLLNTGPRINNSFINDPVNLSHLQKKPRLDIKQDDIMQQQVYQQMLQRQDPMQLQSSNPQLHAMLQQQRLRQQQNQFLQNMSPMQRAQLQQQQQQLQLQQQQQQQQQLRQHLQQQSLQQTAAMKNPYETGGVCARRLMQYLYHQRQRPSQENTIAYWRKFVAEYYAPQAKKRWCLSLYDSVGNHALGVFPQASMDAWNCDVCGSKSGRGFEATYEVLPRLNEIKFGSGVIDELLFVDLPRERRFANGVMMLEYAKAVQESVYEQLRVVREGQLRIIFTQELKILSWDFCARRHEELLTRRLVAPQVNQLLEVAQKCQSTLVDSGSEGVSSQDLQTNSNMVVAAGRQLAKSLELQSLNDLGFSKRYVRCLQIAEVVNSMKDLVDFCRGSKVGPIEGLKSYPRQNPTPRTPMQRMQEMEQLASIQGLPTDRNTINKLLAMQQPAMSNPNTGNNPNILASNRGALSGPAAAALALTNYQSIMRQNSFNSSPNSLQQEASSSLNNSNQSPSSLQGTLQNLSASRFSNSPLNGPNQYNGPQPGPQPGPNNQQSPSLQQQMIQQLLQDVASSNTGAPQKTFSGQNTNVGPATPSASSNAPGGVGPTLSKSNSFKSPSNNDSSNSGFNQKAPEIPQNLHLTDDMVPDLPDDFAENGFFDDDLDDNLGFGWKA